MQECYGEESAFRLHRVKKIAIHQAHICVAPAIFAYTLLNVLVFPHRPTCNISLSWLVETSFISNGRFRKLHSDQSHYVNRGLARHATSGLRNFVLGHLAAACSLRAAPHTIQTGQRVLRAENFRINNIQEHICHKMRDTCSSEETMPPSHWQATCRQQRIDDTNWCIGVGSNRQVVQESHQARIDPTMIFAKCHAAPSNWVRIISCAEKDVSGRSRI